MIRPLARPFRELVGDLVGNIVDGLLRGLLMALLIVAGQQVASAPVGGHPVTEAVLCIGGGLVTVQLDASGNPVGPPHLCPDATLTFLPDVPTLWPADGPPMARPAVPAMPRGAAIAARPATLPPATGPPLRV